MTDFFRGEDMMGTNFYPGESYIYAYDCINKANSNDMENIKDLDNCYKSKVVAAIAQQTEFEAQNGSTFDITIHFRNKKAGQCISELDLESGISETSNNMLDAASEIIFNPTTNTQYHIPNQISLKYTTFVTVNHDWMASVGKSVESVGNNSNAIPRYRAGQDSRRILTFIP